MTTGSCFAMMYESVVRQGIGHTVSGVYQPIEYGEIAQLARAHGSYPWCRGFKSPSRYCKLEIVVFPVFLYSQECKTFSLLLHADCIIMHVYRCLEHGEKSRLYTED